MARSKVKVPLLIEYLERRLGPCDVAGIEHAFYCPACFDRIGVDPSDKKFWINMVSLQGHCYRCKFGFTTLEYLFKYLNGGVLRIEEIAILRREVHPPATLLYPAVADIVSIRREEESEEGLLPQPLPDDMIALTPANLDRPWLRPAMKELQRRLGPKASLRLIERFRIGYCPTGRHAGHLIFPVHQGGEQVYFTTRSIHATGPKSLNPKNRDGYFSRQTCLLNYDNVVGCRQVHMVEGPFDCMAHQNGLALMGKFVSPTHKRLVSRLVEHGLEELVVSLDADAGADIDAAYRALVGRVPRVTCLFLDHGDPDDRKEELPKLLENRRAPTLTDMVRSRLK